VSDILGEAFVRLRTLGDKLDTELESSVVGPAKTAGTKAGKALDDGVSTGTKAATVNAKRDFDKLGGDLQSFGTKATAAISLPITAAFAYSAKAASDLSESVNVTGLTFGEARAEVDKFVKSSAGIGLSERAARDATSAIGGLLVNMGYTTKEAAETSVQMAKLASDMGSAFNKEPAEAAQAIAAAVRGETEQIRAMNVTIDEAAIKQKAMELGLLSATGEVDKHAKAQAVLALIQEQTANVVGDFTNTADGAANSQRILRAEVENQAAALGEKLLPALKAGIGFATDLVGAFAAAPPAAQNVALGIAGIAAAIGPVTGLVGTAAKAMSLFTTTTGEGAAATRSLNGGALAMGAGLAVAGLAVAAFTKGMVDAKNKADEFAKSVEGEVDTSSYRDLTSALEDNYAAAKKSGDHFKERISTWGDGGRAVKEFTELITPLSNKEAELREQTDKLADRNAELQKQLTNANKAMDSFATATGLSRAEVEALAEKNGIDLTQSFGQITTALFKAKDGTDLQAVASGKLADEQANLTDKTASAEDKLKAFQSALEQALGVTIGVTEASIRHQDAIDALRESINENGASLDILNPKSRETAERFNAVVASANAEVQSLIESGAVTEGTAAHKAELVKRLQDLQTQFPALKEPIQQYIDKINAIPDEKATVVTADTMNAQASLDRLMAKIKALPKSVTFGTSIDPNALINDAFGPGRAAGGPVKAGVAYPVGERGRTEWFVPNVDGYVHADKPGSSVTVPVNIVVQGNATADTVEALRSTVREELAATLTTVLERADAGAGTR
jgi:hypothetical protein